VKLSPRWVISGQTKVKVTAAYEISEKFFGYEYDWDKKRKRIFLDCHGDAEEVVCHLLLPSGSQARRVSAGREEIEFQNEMVEKSPYVDFVLSESKSRIEVDYINV